MTPKTKRILELEESLVEAKRQKGVPKDPEDAFNPVTPPKILDDNFPTGSSVKQINSWKEKVKKELPATKQQIFDEYIDQVMAFKHDVKKHRALADVAVAWGLPCKYANEWNSKTIKQIIAVAAILAA